MKTITLENGETRQVSEEKYQELLELKLGFKEVVKEKMPYTESIFEDWFEDWTLPKFLWLNNEQSKKSSTSIFICYYGKILTTRTMCRIGRMIHILNIV